MKIDMSFDFSLRDTLASKSQAVEKKERWKKKPVERTPKIIGVLGPRSFETSALASAWIITDNSTLKI